MLSDDIKQCEGLIKREFVEVPEWWVRLKERLRTECIRCSNWSNVSKQCFYEIELPVEFCDCYEED